MAQCFQRAADRRNGDFAIEFGGLFFAETLRQVVGSEIVGDAETHGGR